MGRFSQSRTRGSTVDEEGRWEGNLEREFDWGQVSDDLVGVEKMKSD